MSIILRKRKGRYLFKEDARKKRETTKQNKTKPKKKNKNIQKISIVIVWKEEVAVHGTDFPFSDNREAEIKS